MKKEKRAKEEGWKRRREEGDEGRSRGRKGEGERKRIGGNYKRLHLP